MEINSDILKTACQLNNHEIISLLLSRKEIVIEPLLIIYIKTLLSNRSFTESDKNIINQIITHPNFNISYVDENNRNVFYYLYDETDDLENQIMFHLNSVLSQTIDV